MKTYACFFGVGVVLASTGLIACGDDAQAEGGGGQGANGDGASAALGVECDGVQCELNQVCAFVTGMCDGARTCQDVASECPARAACGCDGENHPGPCAAVEDSGGILSEDPCPAPEGEFICTYEYQVPIYCSIASEYCHVTATGGVYTLECADRPNACADIPEDCACLDEPCERSEELNYCGIDPETGSITILCLPPMGM